MAIANLHNLSVSLMRDLTEDEATYAEALLDRAERLLMARIPNLRQRAHGEQTGIFHETVADIEAEMVARVFRSPGIYLSESEGEYSYRTNLKVASGLLDVLPEEWQRLGQTPWGSTSPTTDGYARNRFGVPPPYRFQYAWDGDYEGMADAYYPYGN